MDEIVIVPAGGEDADRAVQITREAFDGVSIDQAIEQALGPAAGIPWQDIKAQQVRQEFQTALHNCFVAKAAGQTIGYVTCEVDQTLARGRICNLAVDKRFRGQGVGRLLIRHALDHFRSLGLRQAKIETLAANAVGSHLYPAMGFQEIVRQVHYAMRL